MSREIDKNKVNTILWDTLYLVENQPIQRPTTLPFLVLHAIFWNPSFNNFRFEYVALSWLFETVPGVGVGESDFKGEIVNKSDFDLWFVKSQI